MPGLEARPLGDGASLRPHWHRWPIGRAAFSPRDGAVLWPTGGRVLPLLLAPIDGQVEQSIAVIHRLYAANCGPVSLEDIRFLSQVANDVHPADSASN